jgi:hypothetical protein
MKETIVTVVETLLLIVMLVSFLYGLPMLSYIIHGG